MSEALLELEPHQIGTSLLLSFIIKHAKQALNYDIFYYWQHFIPAIHSMLPALAVNTQHQGCSA